MGTENLFKEIIENLPKLEKKLDIRVQATRTPNDLNTRSPRYISKLSKVNAKEFSRSW